MVLYKNVDIKDLESILSKGVLSLNESGNNNWDDGKRAKNSSDVVYLFEPLTKQNSFPNYGVALLEIKISDSDVTENSLSNNDVNKGRYIEYITEKVPVECIKKIYIPELVKNRVNLPADILSKITWCDIEANYYGDNGKENCPNKVLEQFAKTAKIMDSSAFNFFRGEFENREVIDLYDIQYLI